MTIMINDKSHYAAAGPSRALSLTIRAEALADEIDALHCGICAGLACIAPARWPVTGNHGHAYVISDGHALDARKRLKDTRAGLREGFA
jgi:hypothetical protein